EHRRAVLPEGPGISAGSDLVSFFLFGTFPGAEAEVVIASNHAGYRGNRLLQELLPALGVPQGRPGGEGPQIVTNDGPALRPAQAQGTEPTMRTLPDNGA